MHFHLTFAVNWCILARMAGSSGQLFFDPLQDTEISKMIFPLSESLPDLA